MPALSLRSIIGIGGAIVVALIIWAIVAHFRADDRRQDKLDALTEEAGQVLFATREAADNPKLLWRDAAGQIVALGESNRRLKTSIEEQNLAIDELAAREVQLKARAAELKRIADKAEAQRQSALRRLSDMTITPGTRSDCLKLVEEAETALDLVREASK